MARRILDDILIRLHGIPASTPHFDRWLVSGESLATSALAWSEFLNGPVNGTQVALVESVIGSRGVPFDGATAVVAAALFNKTGRRRGSRIDCLIGATAIRDQADLATENHKDFTPFVTYGLRLLR